MIDVQQPRALVELSRLGTVSAAAESLGFSQSTVSHRLVALSHAAGTVLLTRAGRGMRLTEEGQVLTVRGQEVLDLLEHTEREVVSMARAKAGRVRLAAFPSTVASLMSGVLDIIDRQYPGLRVELIGAEPLEAFEALWCGRVDAALSFSYVDDDAGENLQTKHLLDNVLYFVTHPDDITRIVDGAQCRWVTGCTRCREELFAVGRANGFTLETAYASGDYVAVQALVAAEVGAALLPGMTLSARQHEGVQVRPPARKQRRIEVITRAKRPWPLAIGVLMEAYRTAAYRTGLRRPAVTAGGSIVSQ